MEKILESMTAKVDIDPEPPILVEPKVVDEVEQERELEVVDDPEPEPEVEEPLIETPVDVPANPIMELVPSLTAIRLIILEIA